MPLSDNSRFLISTLETLPLLDGRFQYLHLVNYDSAHDEKRGFFSLVFRAEDITDSRLVAIKFYDIDPRFIADAYRRACFSRESEILQALVNSERCLQLVQAQKHYDLQVPLPSAPGTPPAFATIPCSYFVVEWLDEDLDAYFLEQESISPIAKLELFIEIVLAVEALHRHSVFHRDLKTDNLRLHKVGGRHVVVAIDLGTAASYDSRPLHIRYGSQVGALGYAAPEARCGLSGNRGLAPSNDVYALGCLLFELFNRDYFYNAFLARNPGIDARLAALAMAIPTGASEAEQTDALNAALTIGAHGVTSIHIDAPGNSVDPAITALLSNLLQRKASE